MLLEEEPYFVKIFNVRFPGVNISNELNIIQADSEIKSKIGRPRKISKAGKSILMIETYNAAQSEKLQKIKRIASHEVIVEPHKTLNQVKGVVKSRAFSRSSEEEQS